MEPHKVHRLIAVYDRTSELWVDRISISDATFKFIRSRLKVSDDNPMYDCYPLEGDLLQNLQRMLVFSISETCDYLLEAEIE